MSEVNRISGPNETTGSGMNVASRQISILRKFLMSAGIVLLVQFPGAQAGGFAFGSPVNMTWWPGGTLALSVADFNGDGRDDLAVLYGGHLEVSLQDENGLLGQPVAFGIESIDFLTIAHADIGADGTIEILVGHDAGLAVYKWNGDGFSLENHAASSPCWFMASADLDADGNPDVFCHGYHADAALYYSNWGPSLEAPVYMQTSAYGSPLYVMQAQLKDVTGDARPDLLLATSSSSAFFVYANDGERGFLPADAYSYPSEYALYSGAIEAADFDGDGSNEIVVAMPCNAPCSSVLIYKRGADGYLGLSKTLPTYDIPFGLLVHDFDRNGKPDLLVGHSGWSAVGLYKGGPGGLSHKEGIYPAATHAHSERYSVGDLDHDGYDDLAVSNSFGVSVLYGGQPPQNDFDGDFVSDLLWRRDATGTNSIWLSANSATPQTLDNADAAWSIQATGDFNGDGIDEAFLRNMITGANQILRAGYNPKSVTAVTNQDWQVVGAGDFDGDGRTDLLWRNRHTGANAIWGAGDYRIQQAVVGVTDLRWQVAGVGDFDGDGQSDILWRHIATGNNAIWLSGRFETQHAITAVTGSQWLVQGMGDFDGDGRDDVVWRNAGSGTNAIWLAANYRKQKEVVAVTNLAWAIAAIGDYDGDGLDDLLWRNGRTGANVIWRSADYSNQQVVTAVSPAWQVIR